MTLVSAIESSRWTVLLDVRSPGSYLALHPTAGLARELGIGINWLPIQVPPLKRPSTPAADDDRSIRHRRYRADAIAREIQTYAQNQGLVVRDYYRDPDPAGVNLGWLWVRTRHPATLFAFLADVFRAYWSGDLDPSSVTAVAATVDSLTGDGGSFREWAEDDGAATAAALGEELREFGANGAPCSLVGDQVFLGRQHLPMIRWMLEGRVGPVPI